MKLELKRIDFYERLSEETNAFNADLFVDGKRIADCKNEGHGGSTMITASSMENIKVLQRVEEHIKSLPPHSYGDFSIPMTLELQVDLLLEAWLKEVHYPEKAKKKIALWQSKNNLVFGKKDNLENFGLIKLTHPIEVYVKDTKGRQWLKETIAKHLKEPDDILHNTNVPAELLPQKVS